MTLRLRFMGKFNNQLFQRGDREGWLGGFFSRQETVCEMTEKGEYNLYETYIKECFVTILKVLQIKQQ